MDQAVSYGAVDQLLTTFVLSSNPDVKNAAIESIGRLIVHSHVQEKVLGENSGHCLPMLVAAIQTDACNDYLHASLKTFRVLGESHGIRLWQAVRRLGLRAEVIRPVLRKVRDCGTNGVLVMASCVQTKSHIGFEGDFVNASGQLLDVAMESTVESESDNIRDAILELLGVLSVGDTVQFANSLFDANGIQRLVQLWSSADDIWKKKIMVLLSSILCTVDDLNLVESCIAAGILPCAVFSIQKQLEVGAGKVDIDEVDPSLTIFRVLSSKATCETQLQAIMDQGMLLSVLGRFASGENQKESGFVQRGMALQIFFNICADHSQRILVFEEENVVKSIKSLVQNPIASSSDSMKDILVAQGQACSLLSRLALSVLDSEESVEVHLQPLVAPLCRILLDIVQHFSTIIESEEMTEATYGVVRSLTSLVRHPHLCRLIWEKGLDAIVSLTEASTDFIKNCESLHDAGLNITKDLILILIDISRSWDLSKSLSTTKAPHVLTNTLHSISKMPSPLKEVCIRCVGQSIVDALSNICLRNVGRSAVLTAFEQLGQPARENNATDSGTEIVNRSIVEIFDGLQNSEIAVDMFCRLQEALGCVCVWPVPGNPDRGRLSSAPSFCEVLPVASTFVDPDQEGHSCRQSSQSGLPPHTSFGQAAATSSSHSMPTQPSFNGAERQEPQTPPPHLMPGHSSFYGAERQEPQTSNATNTLPPVYRASYPSAIPVNSTTQYPSMGVGGAVVTAGTVTNNSNPNFLGGNSNGMAVTDTNQGHADVSEESIRNLVEMGFDRQQAMSALESTGGDLSLAASQLLSQGGAA
jgi:hypothetical protein